MVALPGRLDFILAVRVLCIVSMVACFRKRIIFRSDLKIVLNFIFK